MLGVVCEVRGWGTLPCEILSKRSEILLRHSSFSLRSSGKCLQIANFGHKNKGFKAPSKTHTKRGKEASNFSGKNPFAKFSKESGILSRSSQKKVANLRNLQLEVSICEVC
jgi:hypothetical protein